MSASLAVVGPHLWPCLLSRLHRLALAVSPFVWGTLIRAMPCRSDEEVMQLHAVIAVRSRAPPENDGAGHAESDDDRVSTEDDDDAELQLPVKKKRNITTASYVDVKRWVTGDRAEMPEEDIERELF